MGKETVRYPDPLVTQIEDLVANSDHFESKSEFHRFSSEFFLTLLDPDHDPSVLGYNEILQSIETDLGQELTPADTGWGDADRSFLHAYIQVRRYLLRGDVESARSYVTETFEQTDREALLLDELVARYRYDAADPSRTGSETDGSAEKQQVEASGREGGSGDRSEFVGPHPADRTERPAEDSEQGSESNPQESTPLKPPPESG